jgi:hypothetical protein
MVPRLPQLCINPQDRDPDSPQSQDLSRAVGSVGGLGK